MVAIIEFLGLMWIFSFTIAKTNFITMFAASTFYFDSNEKKEGESEVFQAVKVTYANHFGSIAIGSLIIGSCQILQLIFEPLAELATQVQGDSKVAKTINSIGESILKCTSRFSDYMSKAAYSYMAITGEDFCSSAWNSFLLNMSYGLQFNLAKKLATIFIFIGKLFIVVINCLTLLFFMRIRNDLEEVTSRGGPLLVCAVASFFTANLFLGMMDKAVVALLTCLSIDVGVNDFKPKFGPTNFHDSLKNIYLQDDEYEKVSVEMV